MDWTTEQDRQLGRFWLVEGKTMRAIATLTGRSKSSIDRRIEFLGWRGQQNNYQMYNSLFLDAPDEEAQLRPVRLVLPPRPKPKRAAPTDEGVSLHWGDVHFPFHDEAALSILYQLADKVQPTELVCHGDMVDFWQISDHRPPLEKNLKPHQIDLQESINLAAMHQAEMARIAPSATKYYLEGNHEDRFARILTKMQMDYRLRSLMRIPQISEVMSLDYLLELDDWETYSYTGRHKPVLKDRLLCIHGYSATVWASRATLDTYGKSVIFGHTHRIQNFTKRDLNGSISAWNIGCLCNLNPHYQQHTNWSQGFAVVTWKQVDREWLFNVEQVRIHDGRAVWRDNLIKG